jgi:hypothetical protein
MKQCLPTADAALCLDRVDYRLNSSPHYAVNNLRQLPGTFIRGGLCRHHVTMLSLTPLWVPGHIWATPIRLLGVQCDNTWL